MAKKSGANPGDVVRYVPPAEPMVAVVAIAILMIVELVFALGFLILLFVKEGTLIALPGLGTFEFQGNSVPVQQVEGFFLGSAFLTLAAILSLYRKFFLPDVMIVKKRKLKYEDLM